MVLDSVDPVIFAIMVCILFGLTLWQLTYISFYSQRRGPKTCTQSTQTDEESSPLLTIYASKTGKCYHISERCPRNGGQQDIVCLKRCRNCG